MNVCILPADVISFKRIKWLFKVDKIRPIISTERQKTRLSHTACTSDNFTQIEFYRRAATVIAFKWAERTNFFFTAGNVYALHICV